MNGANSDFIAFTDRHTDVGWYSSCNDHTINKEQGDKTFFDATQPTSTIADTPAPILSLYTRPPQKSREVFSLLPGNLGICILR